jgi:hypothetical protein
MASTTLLGARVPGKRSSRARIPPLRVGRVLVLAASVVVWLASAPDAGAVVFRGVEVLSCGGGEASSGSHGAQHTVAQGPVGCATGSGGATAHDGFWFVLPNANTLVEGSFSGTLTEDGTALIRWSVESLDGIAGFNVYRSTSHDGPFGRVNDEMLPPDSTGSYEDATVWPETTFWYEIRAVLYDGTEDAVGGYPVTVRTGGRLALRLYAAYPNPSRGATTLRFEVPSHPGNVFLDIYAADGRRVRTLASGAWDRGRHEIVWDGLDGSGKAAASGVYFARLAVDGDTDIQKVLVVR